MMGKRTRRSAETTPIRLGRRYLRTFLRPDRGGAGLSKLGHPGWCYWASLAAVTLVGLGLRLAFLNHPMRYDESMVYFRYVIHPLHDLATRYDQVQNHLLHTILEHTSWRCFGNSPSVLRLPALIAGTLLAPLAAALGYAVTRRARYGALAGGWVAVSSVLVDYSTNARGYTMACAFTLGMCLSTVGLIQNPRRRRLWVVWAGLAALGTFTIPTMMFPVVGLGSVLVLDAMLRRRRRRRIQLVRLTITLGTWLGLTLLLYAPALLRTGSATVLAIPRAVQSYSEAFFGTPLAVVEGVWQDWMRDALVPALVLGGIGLLLGLGHALRRRSSAWSLPWVMLAGGIGLAGLLPVNAYPRVWLPLLPIILTFAVCGLALIRSTRIRVLAVAILAVSVLLGGFRTHQREFLIAEDPHTLVDAELVAQVCAPLPHHGFGLITAPSTDAVRYYAHLRNLPRAVHPIDPRSKATYVVVNRTQSLEDVLTAKAGAWLRAYRAPVLHCTLPHSRIYRMERRPPAQQIAGMVDAVDTATP
ncbi:MAG: hypothetical protein GY842_12350 [bacterium]|nr:hypothetical protein [bacterium]